jgi:hypothetical protein
MGLTLEEIRAYLGERMDEEPLGEEELNALLEQGRVLGRARVKEARFEAALAGKVTAQAEVLALLGGEPRGEEGGYRDFEVVRRIVPVEKPPE